MNYLHVIELLNRMEEKVVHAKLINDIKNYQRKGL